MDDTFGLTAPGIQWPADGAMIAVSNEGPAATPPISRALRVGRRDLARLEGARWPFMEVAIRSNGRVLDAYVEMRTVTPATIAAVNQALSGIHTCSA